MGRFFFGGGLCIYIQALKPPDRPTPPITKIFCVTFVPNLGQKWHQLAIMIPEKKSELKKRSYASSLCSVIYCIFLIDYG